MIKNNAENSMYIFNYRTLNALFGTRKQQGDSVSSKMLKLKAQLEAGVTMDTSFI